jgi:hypothetical protein
MCSGVDLAAGYPAVSGIDKLIQNWVTSIKPSVAHETPQGMLPCGHADIASKARIEFKQKCRLKVVRHLPRKLTPEKTQRLR